MEKEREARKKMGLGDVREEKMKISPRQKRLGAFVSLGKQRKAVEGKEGKEGKENDTTEEDEEEQVQAATTRSPLQTKSANAVVQPRMAAASCVRKHIDGSGDDALSLVNRFAEKQLIVSVAAITPTKPQRQAGCMIGTVTITEVDYTTELLGLISTQDLQSSDDDDDDDDSTSETILGESKDDHIDEDKKDDNGEGNQQEDDNDFADADFEELAQNLQFSPPSAVADPRQVLKQEKKAPKKNDALLIDERSLKNPQTSDQKKRNFDNANDDTFFDAFAPSSQDFLDLVEVNEYDAFEISTQDIQFLDPP